MKALSDKIINSSVWVKIAFCFFFVLCVYSAYSAFDEPNPIAATFEILFATIFANGNQVASLIAGYFAGKMIGEKSGKKWLAWVIGVAVFLVATTAISLLASEIPGVGWRYNAICSESSYC